MFGAQFFTAEVKAVSSEQVHPTCKPMMTTIKFGSNKKVTMECDTAASHNILSQESYQEIWPRGTGPKLTYKNVRVMLADGSRSAQQTRSMECSVVAANGKRLKLHFFVMNGPNNLLGRLALSTIWPKEYGALKDVAEVPVKKMVVPAPKSQFRSAPIPKSQSKSAAPVVVSPPRVCPSQTQPRDVTDLSQDNTSCPAPLTADDDVTAVDQSIPPRRQAPPVPAGVITEEMGKKYCRELINLYPEIFDGKKGHFRGVQAELFIKEGHEELLKKKGVRPPAKVP